MFTNSFLGLLSGQALIRTFFKEECCPFWSDPNVENRQKQTNSHKMNKAIIRVNNTSISQKSVKVTCPVSHIEDTPQLRGFQATFSVRN